MLVQARNCCNPVYCFHPPPSPQPNPTRSHQNQKTVFSERVRAGSRETTCTGAAQVSPALCQNPKPTSVPDADTVHLLARVEADPCIQPLLVLTGYGGAGSAEVRPWWLFWSLQPGTDHFPRPLVSDGNNAGLPSSQALLRVDTSSEHQRAGRKEGEKHPCLWTGQNQCHSCHTADT